MAGEQRVQAQYYSGDVCSEKGFQYPIQRAFADPASSGDNQLVAAPGVGKAIRVLAAMLMNNVATAQNARFRSAANSIGPLMAFGAVANGILNLDFNALGWVQTNANEALNINLSAATAVGVQIIYIVVDL